MLQGLKQGVRLPRTSKDLFGAAWLADVWPGSVVCDFAGWFVGLVLVSFSF